MIVQAKPGINGSITYDEYKNHTKTLAVPHQSIANGNGSQQQQHIELSNAVWSNVPPTATFPRPGCMTKAGCTTMAGQQAGHKRSLL